MTIQKLDLGNGIPLRDSFDPAELADRLIEKRADELVTLAPGIYDFVPPDDVIFPTTQDELTVLDNGAGLYRSVSLSRFSLATLIRHGRLEEHGGTPNLFQLPVDRTRILVVGFLKQIGSLPRLCNIIQWVED